MHDKIKRSYPMAFSRIGSSSYHVICLGQDCVLEVRVLIKEKLELKNPFGSSTLFHLISLRYLRAPSSQVSRIIGEKVHQDKENRILINKNNIRVS